MNREISQRELYKNSAAVLRAVQDGESITITNNDIAVAELVPPGHGCCVNTQVAIEAFSGAPRIDLKTLYDDLDRIAAPDFQPRD